MPPHLPHRVRLFAGTTALAVGLAVISPLAPAAADDRPDLTRDVHGRAMLLPDATGRIDPEAQPSAGGSAPKIKGWGKAKRVAGATNGFQSYAIARNAKGQGVVAWSELGNGTTRVWYARLNPKNKVVKRQRLTKWIKNSVDDGISGQVTAAIDKRGRATVGWTQRSGRKTGARAAQIRPKGKVTKRWLTKGGPPPMGLQSHASPSGHVVIWWNGYDPKAWGNPQHYVLHQGRKAWKKMPYAKNAAWMPDEGGSASVSNSGLVTATWVERASSSGRLRAVTLNRKGRTTDQTVATASSQILNSSHTSTKKGQVTVSFMDSRLVNGLWPSTWYSVRRTKGTWGAKTVVPKSGRFGYTWSIDGNNKGKVAMIGLGYSPQSPPKWMTVTAGIQNRPGKKWTVSGVAPRVSNQLSLFSPRVHVTASGRTIASYRGKKKNGISWNRKGKNGKWQRAAINNVGDFLFASDKKSRVTMLVPVSSPRARLVVYRKKL